MNHSSTGIGRQARMEMEGGKVMEIVSGGFLCSRLVNLLISGEAKLD